MDVSQTPTWLRQREWVRWQMELGRKSPEGGSYEVSTEVSTSDLWPRLNLRIFTSARCVCVRVCPTTFLSSHLCFCVSLMNGAW